MIKQFLFFQVIYLGFSLLVYFVPQPWFIYFPKEILYAVSLIISILHFFLFIFKKDIKINIEKKQEDYSRGVFVILLTSLFLFIFLPIRNLNLGDGILLLEHVALESRIFGFHLTMDEILEAMIHSLIFAKFKNIYETPMEVYRLVSTISGFTALAILYLYFRKFKMHLLSYLTVLVSGGIYLFHGYSENYTIVTTLLWFYILYSIEAIRSNRYRNLRALIPICIIACLLILSHLVSGYLILSLIYLCYYFSDSKKFIKNAIVCTVFSLFMLAPIFLYFSFFSDVRFDFTQTHLTNPKFYPVSRIISIHHFRDIIFCLIGSAFLPSILLIYGFIFNKSLLISYFKKKEIVFLNLVLVGFSIHGFVHYPQLGFPADWDLLAFFWSPIAFLGAFFISYSLLETRNEDNQYISIKNISPVYLFSIILYVLNAFYLSRPDNNKLLDLKKSLVHIEQFANSKETTILKSVNPKYKKFYLQVSFFLFESREKIKGKYDDSNVQGSKLLAENDIFLDELNSNIDSVESKWQKSFYNRLTTYHIEYLNYLKEK